MKSEYKRPVKLLFLAIAIATAAPILGTELTFSVVPQQNPQTLGEIWSPILKFVSQNSGYKIQFVTAPDIPTFKENLLAGEYDLVYANPVQYVMANEKQGYRALVRAKDKRIRGILVVHKDSKVRKIEDLQNTTLAFPSPGAFAASMLTRHHLAHKNIAFTAKWVKTHDNVYEGVSRGFFPSGGGVMRTLNATRDKARESLRVLWTSEGYTPHAIAIHGRHSRSSESYFAKPFLAINGDTPVLGHVRNRLKIKGYESARDQDWDDVRGVRAAIDKLQKH